MKKSLLAIIMLSCLSGCDDSEVSKLKDQKVFSSDNFNYTTLLDDRKVCKDIKWSSTKTDDIKIVKYVCEFDLKEFSKEYDLAKEDEIKNTVTKEVTKNIEYVHNAQVKSINAGIEEASTFIKNHYDQINLLEDNEHNISKLYSSWISMKDIIKEFRETEEGKEYLSKAFKLYDDPTPANTALYDKNRKVAEKLIGIFISKLQNRLEEENKRYAREKESLSDAIKNNIELKISNYRKETIKSGREEIKWKLGKLDERYDVADADLIFINGEGVELRNTKESGIRDIDGNIINENHYTYVRQIAYAIKANKNTMEEYYDYHLKNVPVADNK